MANVVIILYFVLVIIGQFFEGNVLPPVISVLGFCTLLWQAPYIFKKQRHLLIIFSIFAIYSAFCVFIFQSRASLTSLRLFVHFTFFLLIFRYDIKPWLIRFLVIVYSLYVCGSVLVYGINPNTIFVDSSKNFVGWIGLVMGVLYYALRYKNGEKFEVYTAAIILLLAFVCVGRSTIISALLLFLTVFLTAYKQFNLVTKILTVSFFAGLILFFFSDYFELLELAFTQFERKGFESADRLIVLNGYFDKLNFFTFMFGVTPNQYPFTILNGNFHNSFLLAHSLFGALSILFFVFLFYTLVNRGLNNLFLKALLTIILLRSLTDELIFISFFDFVIFYIVFLLADKSAYPSNKYSPNALSI